MSFFNWLIGKGGNAIESVSNGVDRFIHTNQDRANEMAKEDKEITKRWVADSEAPITRLTRPFLVIFVTIVTFVFGALDGNLAGFSVKSEYLSLYKELMIVMVVAYFGSRGFEKVKRGK